MDSKIFTYVLDGLSFTVTVYEEDGAFYADIAVSEGSMDVNAVYFGDDDFSGKSESLSGPLNMNGARLDGEKVQWDNAAELSDPGLGPEGEDKETFVSEGDTLMIELDIDSLDEIDVFGIRATSTSTDEGSIKAVSDDPEEPEEPEEPLFEKVGFGYEIGDNGIISNGVYVNEDSLPEDQDPTFENYVDYFLSETDGNIAELETVIFYEIDDQDNPQELFRLDAPEGGYEDSEALVQAFGDAIDNGALDALDEGDDAMSLMAALSLDDTDGSGGDVDSEADEPELEGLDVG